MELKLQGDLFYLLDLGEEKRIYDSENEAITSLTSFVTKHSEVDPASVSIWEVNASGEQWQIKAVPWSRIALELMRGK